jgi:hypothetical protein
MDLGELAVGVGKLQPERTRRLVPAAADFRQRVFETADDIDARAVFVRR